MTNHPYRQTTERSCYGEVKNACMLCGKTRTAHDPPEVRIYFQGRLRFYANWDLAHEDGFFIGDSDKLEDYGLLAERKVKDV